MYRVRLGALRARSTALLVLALASQVILAHPAAAEPRVLPSQVHAVYRISFGLLGEIGAFNFKSAIDGDSYTLSADAKIDTTVFDYKGSMQSSGLVEKADATRPGGYQFSYRQKALLGKKIGIRFG